MDEQFAQVALEAITQELEKDGSNAYLWFEKGRLLSVLGRQQEALEALRKAMELDPDLQKTINGNIRKQ